MLNLPRLFIISAKRTISFKAINNFKMNYLKITSKRTAVIQCTVVHYIILHTYKSKCILLKNVIFLV